MSAAETKNLQTVDRGGWLAEASNPKLRASQPSIVHDARIAHEQREVIRKLVVALEAARLRVAIMHRSLHTQMDNALESAAPYLCE